MKLFLLLFLLAMLVATLAFGNKVLRDVRIPRTTTTDPLSKPYDKCFVCINCCTPNRRKQSGRLPPRREIPCRRCRNPREIGGRSVMCSNNNH
uniref:Secreted protein n=1 Tax=Panagrellus redivivus TaxID=6233 RepID=A0A7E4VQ12_PANRE